MRIPNLSRRLAGVSLTLLLVACDMPVDPSSPPAGVPETDPVVALGAGIHPILRLSRPSPDVTDVSLVLRRVDVVAAVAAYQVELSYDPGRLKVLEGSFPEGILGAWFEVEPGRVRIAGARLDGMEDGEVLSLRFAATGSVEDADFELSVEELSSAGTFEDLRPLAVAPGLLPDHTSPLP